MDAAADVRVRVASGIVVQVEQTVVLVLVVPVTTRVETGVGRVEVPIITSFRTRGSADLAYMAPCYEREL